ncbi:hypothetical protein D0T84_09795 [Dysgonomonas sp. 521]|uniref:hypothetical protein n=1 Tax=Dysgonomonas sp. 521 TaxID=2302932 RepID=UPI0013D67FEB|nr:hypothetical protein [Dysgonomonas sp. 521]NDV95211.1 hypothetical protein [Dysgonomonas sp. 521]
MTKRIFSLSLLIVLCISIYANMSSPWRDGDLTSDAYSGKDIDILHESLQIKLIDFYTAKFTVAYRIKSDRAGKQIPLIFDTMTGKESNNGAFRAWLDEEELTISEIPSSYENPNALQWIDSLDNHLLYSKENSPDLIGLKYFEVDLTEGEHIIKVEYTAQANIYLSESVKEFTLKYNLAPARYWRSFSGLYIEIDKTGLAGSFETNLPDHGKMLTEPITHLYFTEIPSDELTITYTPKVNLFAKGIIGVGTSLAFVILFILLILLVIALHIWLVIKYRYKYPDRRFSQVALIGSVLVPVVCAAMSMLSLAIINGILGSYASFSHSGFYLAYSFAILCLLLIPLYIMLIILLDRYIKNKRK